MYRGRRILSVIVWLLAPSASASPTLSIDFGGGIHAIGRNGETIAPQFVGGRPPLVRTASGIAMRSGPGFGALQFPTRGILSSQAGTVEMWVAPVDWSGDDTHFHVFFDVRGTGGALFLYKYYNGGLLMLSCQGARVGPYNSAGADVAGWHSGQWHYIAGTWSPSYQRLYIDGKRVADTTPLLPTAIGPTFTMGDMPWHLQRRTSTLIRRVRVYDRRLSDAEIAAHAAGHEERISLVPTSIDIAAHEVRGAARVTIEVAGEPSEIDGAIATLTITDERGATRSSTTVRLGPGGRATATVSTSRLPAGRYSLTAAIAQTSGRMVTQATTIDIPKTDWLGNSLGELREVPPPWTGLKVRRNAAGLLIVESWGRQYSFRSSALPEQIVSQGEPLLRRPILLTLGSAAGSIAFSSKTFEVTDGALVTTLRSAATGRIATGEVRLESSTRIEYDGLIVIDLDVVAPSSMPRTEATLDIPLAGNVAKYRQRWTDTGEAASGNMPPGTGVVEHDHFVPFAWLGDDSRGLFWFAESDEAWPNRDGGDAVALVRERDAVILRLRLAAGQPLPRRWHVRFGLQATPTKPFERQHEPWRIAPASDATTIILWPRPTSDSMRYYGYAEAKDDERFAARVATDHRRGLSVLPYSGLTHLSTQAPEYRWFEPEWRVPGGDSSSSDVTAFGGAFARVNPASRSFDDFVVWKNVEFLRRHHLDGFYFDNSQVYACALGTDGCGYRDEAGRIRATYPVLAYRDLYRRLYVAIKRIRPDAKLIAHCSGNVWPPLISYDDAYVDGEWYRGRVGTSYSRALPVDKLRAEFTGKQLGVRAIFLPELSPEDWKTPGPTRSLLALLLPHDIPAWPQFSRLDVLDEAYAALDRFGVASSSFVRYDHPHPVALTDVGQVYVSGYRQTDGHWLLAIGNLAQRWQHVAIRVDLRQLGAPNLAAVDWERGTSLPVHGAAFDLDIPAEDYRLVELNGIH